MGRVKNNVSRVLLEFHTPANDRGKVGKLITGLPTALGRQLRRRRIISAVIIGKACESDRRRDSRASDPLARQFSFIPGHDFTENFNLYRTNSLMRYISSSSNYTVSDSCSG